MLSLGGLAAQAAWVSLSGYLGWYQNMLHTARNVHSGRQGLNEQSCSQEARRRGATRAPNLLGFCWVRAEVGWEGSIASAAGARAFGWVGTR